MAKTVSPIGKTKAEIIATYGAPLGKIEIGETVILEYKTQRFEIVRNKTTEVIIKPIDSPSLFTSLFARAPKPQNNNSNGPDVQVLREHLKYKTEQLNAAKAKFEIDKEQILKDNRHNVSFSGNVSKGNIHAASLNDMASKEIKDLREKTIKPLEDDINQLQQEINRGN
jgi:hypothetical protein